MPIDVDLKRARDRKYYAANREKILAYQREYTDRHKAEKREYDAAYRQRPDRKEKERSRDRSEYNREFLAANREMVYARHRAYLAANHDKIKAKKRVAYSRNRKSVLVTAAKTRARLFGLEFDLSVNALDWPEYCPVFGVKLNYQGVGRCENSPSLDRLIPSKGYIKSNVRVICFRANRLKNNATPDELRRLAEYASQAE